LKKCREYKYSQFKHITSAQKNKNVTQNVINNTRQTYSEQTTYNKRLVEFIEHTPLSVNKA